MPCLPQRERVNKIKTHGSNLNSVKDYSRGSKLSSLQAREAGMLGGTSSLYGPFPIHMDVSAYDN